MFFVCFQDKGESSSEPAVDQPAAQQRRINQQRSSNCLISVCEQSIYLTVLLVDILHQVISDILAHIVLYYLAFDFYQTFQLD